MPASDVDEQSRAEAAAAMAAGRAARREQVGEQADDTAAAADSDARDDAVDGTAGAAAASGPGLAATGPEQADREPAGEQAEANAPRERDGEEPDAAEPPEALRCPLTLAVMTDPVQAADGRTYEREAIKTHLANRNTSPLTNLPLENKVLLVNWFARDMIEQAGHPLVANPLLREDLSPPSTGAPVARAAAAAEYTCRMEGTLVPVASGEWRFHGEWWSTSDTESRMRFEYKVSVPLSSLVSMMFRMAAHRRLEGPRRPSLVFSGHYDLPERAPLLASSETTFVRRVKDDFTLTLTGGLHHSDPNPRARQPFADSDSLRFAGNHPSGRYANLATLQALAPAVDGEAYQFTLRIFRQYARRLRDEGRPQLAAALGEQERAAAQRDPLGLGARLRRLEATLQSYTQHNRTAQNQQT